MEENGRLPHLAPPDDAWLAYRARSRGAEIGVRIAVCAMSAALVSLGWILASSAAMSTKAMSAVLCLCSLATVALVIGNVRAEVSKARADIARTEARLLEAFEVAVECLYADPGRRRPEPSPSGSPFQPARQDRRRGRPPQRRRPVQAQAADASISEELRIFLQGRESAYGDDGFGDDRRG